MTSTEEAVKEVLRDNPQLRKQEYTGDHPLSGHCYVASEAYYHLEGGPNSSLKPCNIKHEGVSHWFIKDESTGEIIDLTVEQFDTPVPYSEGRGRGFLTRDPSKRCQVVLGQVKDRFGITPWFTGLQPSQWAIGARGSLPRGLQHRRVPVYGLVQWRDH